MFTSYLSKPYSSSFSSWLYPHNSPSLIPSTFSITHSKSLYTHTIQVSKHTKATHKSYIHRRSYHCTRSSHKPLQWPLQISYSCGGNLNKIPPMRSTPLPSFATESKPICCNSLTLFYISLGAISLPFSNMCVPVITHSITYTMIPLI